MINKSKAKPILFNTDMVRAILDGRKSVTRRVAKSKNHIRNIDNYNGGYQGRYIMTNLLDGIPREFTEMLLPRYRIGDILYVRETWSKINDIFIYAENTKHFEQIATQEKFTGVIKWHPSIHMPKEAARIFLKVTAVWVERLRDITEEQAIKEGFNSRKEFISAILKMYPERTEDSWVWVYEFERVNVND